MTIVSLSEAKAQLNIDVDDTRNDDELKTWLPPLTAVVERELRQVVEQREVTDIIELDSATRFCLSQVPVAELGGVTRLSDNAAYDTSGFVVTPIGLVLVIGDWALTGVFEIDYTAGPDVVPDNVKRGALQILQHTWESQRGVGTVSAAGRSYTGEWSPELSFSIPNRAREWLGPPMPVLP